MNCLWVAQETCRPRDNLSNEDLNLPAQAMHTQWARLTFCPGSHCSYQVFNLAFFLVLFGLLGTERVRGEGLSRRCGLA